jgi:hypothetical protein
MFALVDRALAGGEAKLVETEEGQQGSDRREPVAMREDGMCGRLCDSGGGKGGM